jgi:hypothetical protein
MNLPCSDLIEGANQFDRVEVRLIVRRHLITRHPANHCGLVAKRLPIPNKMWPLASFASIFSRRRASTRYAVPPLCTRPALSILSRRDDHLRESLAINELPTRSGSVLPDMPAARRHATYASSLEELWVQGVTRCDERKIRRIRLHQTTFEGTCPLLWAYPPQ